MPDDLVAIQRVPDKSIGGYEGADKIDDRLLVGLSPASPRRYNLELKCCHSIRRETEPPITLFYGDEIVWLAKRHGVALTLLKAFKPSGCAYELLYLVVSIVQPLEREQLACRNRNRVDRQRQSY